MYYLIGIVNYLLYPLVKVYWRIFKPKTAGVKVIIKYKDEVLLVRNSYGSKKWTLPGGGVKKGESMERAAIREVREEIGISLNSVIRKGYFVYNQNDKEDTIHVFFSEVCSPDFKINSLEILEVGWKSIEESYLSPSLVVKKCLEMI
jgi:8-oxo-dGTP pyrophosphatase MutT (NUDIX family)